MTLKRRYSRKAIAEKGLDKWGITKQMLMVAEESLELSHAVLKWLRAYDSYNKADDSNVSVSIHQRKLTELEERENNIILEASQLRLVMEILPLVIKENPARWHDINNEVLNKATIKVGLI